MSSLKTSELTSLLNKSFKETGRLRKGNNLQYHCPFCHHHKMKMEVCLDEPNQWHCWVCNTKGNDDKRMEDVRDAIVLSLAG